MKENYRNWGKMEYRNWRNSELLKMGQERKKLSKWYIKKISQNKETKLS